MQAVFITSKASLSSLGHTNNEIWQNYQKDKSSISICCFNNTDSPTAKLSTKSQYLIDQLRTENNHYRRLDKSVLMAIFVGRQALAKSSWKDKSNIGINIGSSRGATQLFEHFIKSPSQRMSPIVSPTTTLGNISSWLAFDLGCQGLTISHSITCSTALHSILNACAWINSGFSNKFIAGGSEAPLTDFTISQMRALGIYSTSSSKWKCSPLKSKNTQNSMVLGEGAAVFCLEKNNHNGALAKIIGIGFATEKIQHHASLSSDAKCIKKSMKMALETSQLDTVDAIVMHAPGTQQGDQSELKAIHAIFGAETPHLISTKFQTGHTLGASGGISLDLAIEMINNKQFLCFPYQTSVQQSLTTFPKTVLVNAVGFGGNAVSIIVQKAD